MEPATIAVNTGNAAFILVCTSLVIASGHAIMIQNFVSMGGATVIWFAFGNSMCFGPSLDRITPVCVEKGHEV